jgi:diadenosine tetraphosphate (Ap4A) HIT family hydrolase
MVVHDKPESYVNLSNARNDEQRKVMKDILSQEECPFCEQNFSKYHKKPILRNGEHWIITHNQWPYDYTRTHLIAISRYHTENFTDLKDGALDELQQHINWALQKFSVGSGGVALRFGDVRSNGASVRHLHAHIIEPDPDKPKAHKVRFKIS